MRLPKAHHEVHGERQALLFLLGARSHLNPGHVDGEVVLRQLFSEAEGTGDHRCRRCRREKTFWPGGLANDTPQQEIRVPRPPGPRIDRDRVGGVLV